MVWQNGSTVRCRKERVSSVRSLIDVDIDTLGKSGVQLSRDSSPNIQVLLKQERIGIISDDVLENALKDLSTGKLSSYDA